MMQMSQKLKRSKAAAVTGVNIQRNTEVFPTARLIVLLLQEAIVVLAAGELRGGQYYGRLADV
jgi:hypothetical protein